MLHTLTTLLLLLLLTVACSRPIAPPPAAVDASPWGSVILDTTKDDSPFDIRNSLGKSLKQKLLHSDSNSSRFNILAISGGGSQGAYGCGVLDGWNQTKTMPNFDVVTGISTGSIISSFIFLGGEYVHQISEIYLSIETSDIYYYNPFKIFGGASISSTKPLKEMIKEHITPELLKSVAREHKKGRRLYVGTTNIDSGSLTVWDMGAIAASNHKEKLQLYRDIIYASSAIPGLFDPQYFALNYKGATYYQMHIDGGMNSYVFMIGMYDDWHTLLNLPQEKKLNVSLYILSNRHYRYKKRDQALKNDSVASIIEAVVKNSIDLIYDRSIYRLYTASRQNGYKFYYTGIDDNITLNKFPHEFDAQEMQRLYDEGYQKGINGIKWQRDIVYDELLKH